jgi:ABC-2 type transport system ATP-binding protein
MGYHRCHGDRRHCCYRVVLLSRDTIQPHYIMNEPALLIDKLEKTYATGMRALNGVSLSIPQGELFALLGPNGAGKTTLIGIVTGLVDKTGGRVEVFGVDIEKEAGRTRSMIGLCGQEINFDPWMKPVDVVVNQAGYYGIPRSVAIPRAQKILADLGLGDKMDQIGFRLSGGMKRRLMIARALIHEPKFLILDEPTAGVDVELRRSMWDYLTKLTKQGITILLTTHYLEEAERLAKNVAIINKGEIILQGSMEEVLKMHEGGDAKDGYGGGKLEEIFVRLTSN